VSRTSGNRRRQSSTGRRIALWYVLASSYALARLLINRIISGVWEVDASFVACLVGVTLVQLPVLDRLLSKGTTTTPDEHSGDDRRGQEHP
jgi:hypothetical protein